MQLETEATVLVVRGHGEHNAVVRALTREAGVLAGYVRGGRSRRLRPVLMPGNRVQAEFRARTDEQLAHLTAELVHSRAFLFSDPLPAAGVEWSCALTVSALPEGQAYPQVAEALEGLLAAIEAAPSARGWAAALVRYELTLLAALGFGIEPRRLAGLAPEVLSGPATAGWKPILEALALTGRHLARDLLVERQSEALVARERLVARLQRAGG